MVSFLKRHSQPVITTLSSIDDVVKFSIMDKVTVVGYFDEDDHISKMTFTDVAKVYRDKYLFGAISNITFSRVEDVKKPSIVLYKAFDEGKSLYTEEFDAEKIKGFLAETASPLISEIGVDLNSFPANVSFHSTFEF